MSLGTRRRRPPTPGFVANNLWRRAGEIPSFHISPAALGHARDLITGAVIGSYNSATPAMAVGPDGLLFTPAANAPVIEYDPATGACLGARIWGVVTNQIRNNSAVGAVAGMPGTLPTNWVALSPSNGLSRQIVRAGSIGGLSYVDIRYFGTTTAASSTVIQPEIQTTITAASGQTWTGSAWIAIVGGSTAGINQAGRIRVSGRLSTATLQESAQVDFTPTPELIRRSISYTLVNATTARVSLDIIFTYNSGAAIDITLRIGLPQLEQSATMGPVVATSGVAASSTADVWTITGADFNRIWNQAQGTIYGDGSSPSSGPFLVPRATTNFNDRIQFCLNNLQSAVVFGGVIQYISGSGTGKRAMAFAANDFAQQIQGQAINTDSAGAVPSVDYITIGRFDAGNQEFFNGYIREGAIFRSRRPNANLQAVASS